VGADFRDRLYARYVSAFKGIAPRDASDLERRRAWSRIKILPLLQGVDRSAPLLELGCGPGDLLGLLREEGFGAAEGIDVSAEQVAIAAARGLPVRHGDALALLREARERYAAILAIDFFEHFTKDELLDLFPLVHEALRPGGVLLLQTPNGEGLFPNAVIYGDLTHVTIFTPGSLEHILTLAGFAEIRCFETGPAPKNLAGRLRGLAWSVIKLSAGLVRRIETGKAQRIWTENLICRCRRPL
jgi:SAM-dependent methyltransferase